MWYINEMDIKDYMDTNGLIVGKAEDPGDSCHRTMMTILGLQFLGNFPYAESLYVNGAITLEVPGRPYRFRRSASPGWWSEDWRFSRDQSIPLIIAMGEFGSTYLILGFMLFHILRLGFFTNIRRNGSTKENHGEQYYHDAKPLTKYHKIILKYKIPFLGVPKGHRNYNFKLPDIIGFQFIGLYIRGLNLKILYPVLFISDFFTFLAAAHWRYFRDDDNDVLNHIIITRYIRRKYPTFFSKLIDKVEDKDRMYNKMKLYSERVGIPMHELWKGLIYASKS